MQTFWDSNKSLILVFHRMGKYLGRFSLKLLNSKSLVVMSSLSLFDEGHETPPHHFKLLIRVMKFLLV